MRAALIPHFYLFSLKIADCDFLAERLRTCALLRYHNMRFTAARAFRADADGRGKTRL